MESIENIKKNLESIYNSDVYDLKEKLVELKKDSRKTVGNLVEKYEKLYKKLELEKLRIQKMTEFENNFLNQGFKNIFGIDEVGRGPLAGPVVVSSVIFPESFFKEKLEDLNFIKKIYGINDSKKVSEVRRKELFEIISKEAKFVSIGISSNQIIDEINILNADIEAMKESINKFSEKPDILLIDAVKIPNINIRQVSIIKGDEKSVSIASASIIAKVTRDNMMEEYHKEYPQYDFINNKGYGTKKHIEAIKEYGITPIHRKSFLKNYNEV